MADLTVCISQQQQQPIKVLKWKVHEGSAVSIGRIILLYSLADTDKLEQKRLKSPRSGTVHKLLAQEGVVVNPGEALLELRPCRHPTIMNEMCAECGADLRKDEERSTTASVPMIHAIPDLKVSEELAQKLGKADNERLLKDRKLVLLVDLDQTVIHTTNDNIPPNIKDVYHFQLYGRNSPWYHTRLRPYTLSFLKNIFDYFELHICTFGARNYAHTIAMFLDPDQKFFSHRILSRDECFDPTSKKANLKALFPCGDNMVCIIDDREDVWSHASNLIHVKPYHFFQHTGDINAPPGLDKHENDEKTGVDLTNVKEKCQNGQKVNGCSLDSKTEAEQKETDKTEQKETVETKENETEEAEKVKEAENKVPEVKKVKEAEDKIPEVKKVKEAEDKVPEAKENESDKKEEDLIEIEDPDDYLIYLEGILKRIHKTFYEEFDSMESGKVPDLKKVIPSVRNRVLEGCKLAFSGLVPTHIKLEQSKAYQVARSLGATVSQDIEDDTTHLVAVRPGTAKVNAGKRKKNLKIVTPDWLWSCAERWEHADERVFPLSSKGSKNRHPPPHCSSPEHSVSYPEHEAPGARKRSPSGRFMDTINPLMSFSTADIADMDKEVEDILDDESDSSEEDKKEKPEPKPAAPEEESSSSSSEESLTAEFPKGFKRKRLEQEEGNSAEEDEFPSTKFRRGEAVGEELDLDSQDSENSIEPPDEADDGEWNMMGAALEREFLSNN